MNVYKYCSFLPLVVSLSSIAKPFPDTMSNDFSLKASLHRVVMWGTLAFMSFIETYVCLDGSVSLFPHFLANVTLRQ